jgi:hypothetical protein
MTTAPPLSLRLACEAFIVHVATDEAYDSLSPLEFCSALVVALRETGLCRVFVVACDLVAPPPLLYRRVEHAFVREERGRWEIDAAFNSAMPERMRSCFGVVVEPGPAPERTRATPVKSARIPRSLKWIARAIGRAALYTTGLSDSTNLEQETERYKRAVGPLVRASPDDVPSTCPGLFHGEAGRDALASRLLSASLDEFAAWFLLLPGGKYL